MKCALALISMFLLASEAVLAGVFDPHSKATPNSVRLLVPSFAGGPLGTNVATILNLQVWQTLRIPAGEGRYTVGEVALWDEGWLDERWIEPPSSLSPSPIADAARRAGAQAVLWGEAFRYADGTLVQAYLTLPPPDPAMHFTSFQEWTLRIPLRGVTHVFSVDLPSRAYEFDTIVLPNAIVENYTRPADLKFYSAPRGGDTKGIVGRRNFRAISNDGDAVQIVVFPDPVQLPDGRRGLPPNRRFPNDQGWVRLPQLSGSRNGVVDFTGAVMRILRRDWGGATELLARVLSNESTPATIAADAHLLRALAAERTGQPWRSDLDAAWELNPYQQSTIAYAIMFQVSDCASALKRNDSAAAGSALRRAEEIAAEKKAFFAADDRLLGALAVLARAYREHAER